MENTDIDMSPVVAKNLNIFQMILFRPSVEEICYHTKVQYLMLQG